MKRSFFVTVVMIEGGIKMINYTFAPQEYKGLTATNAFKQAERKQKESDDSE